MARCPFAAWDPISGGIGPFRGGPLKVVHHKTYGSTLAGARGAYRANRSDPHFTVHPGGVSQHVDTGEGSRSLVNKRGGVETNFDGAIQIETVGPPTDHSTLVHLVRLLRWIEEEHHVPWAWPEGRPPTSGGGNRDSTTWDGTGGHYGHSQVPENDHTDPAYTDEEWAFLNEQMTASAVPTTPGEAMARFPNAVMAIERPGHPGQAWVAGADGGVGAFGGAPVLGSMGGKPLGAPISAIVPTVTGNGYWLLGRDGGVFSFGDAQFWGSYTSLPLAQRQGERDIVGGSAHPDGRGYTMLGDDGGIYGFRAK
jgi:hypothetical protein